MPAPKCPECKTIELLYVQKVYEYHAIENFEPADENGDYLLDLQSLEDSFFDEEYDPWLLCPECERRFTMAMGPVPESQVVCSICHEKTNAKTAHMHQGEWIGDDCCWIEALRSSE